MVKLSTARENRMYGPRGSQNTWEYINVALYVLASVLVVGGVMAQLTWTGSVKSGLIALMIGLLLFAIVTAHDIYAHLASVDYNVVMIEYDPQLGLVELAAPLVETVGSVLTFVGILFLYLQVINGYSHSLETHAINLLIAGPVFWLLGSIHDTCQIYERAEGSVQILQKSVQIPFLIGSLLFLLAGIFNRHGAYGPVGRHYRLLAKSWVWLSIFGSLLFFIGGLLNVLKVYKMQQTESWLERLRGNAHEWLNKDREGKMPLLPEEHERRKPHGYQPHGREEERPSGGAGATPYKNVVVGEA